MCKASGHRQGTLGLSLTEPDSTCTNPAEDSSQVWGPYPVPVSGLGTFLRAAFLEKGSDVGSLGSLSWVGCRGWRSVSKMGLFTGSLLSLLVSIPACHLPLPLMETMKSLHRHHSRKLHKHSHSSPDLRSTCCLLMLPPVPPAHHLLYL